MGKNACFRRRVVTLQQTLSHDLLDALLITQPANCRYLSGFTGSACRLLVSANDCMLIVDGRYVDQAAAEAPHCRVIRVAGSGYAEATAKAIAGLGLRTVGFESGWLSYWDHGRLELLLGKQARLIPSGGQVEAIREIKDSTEIEALRRSAWITAEALSSLMPWVKPGMSEKAIAAELDHRMRLLGGEPPAFETLVASGPRTALPHARPTDRAVEAGELLLIDCGSRYGGYAADCARTWVVGGLPDPRQKDILEAVAEARKQAIATAGPGVERALVDEAARHALDRRGLAEAFTHGLGHGLGLEVHEEPWLAPDEHGTLEPGMVFTIEPGVYLPGYGGARIEDILLVTEQGVEVLTRTPVALGALSAPAK